MSYYRTILADFPVSYYTLDDLSSACLDYSGNNNTGTLTGSFTSKIMPLVSGGVYGTLITNLTTIGYTVPGMANKYYSDNPFTIETWVKLPNTSSSLVPIVADTASSIGIFCQSGDLVFKAGTNIARYKVTNNKAIHVVATYNKQGLSVYINGSRVITKSLDGFVFTNSTTAFTTGPSLSNNYFIIDSVAFYRYTLSNSTIMSHYTEGIKELKYNQIVYPDGGYLFSLHSSKNRPSLRYYYPGTKSWTNLANENVIVSNDQSYVSFLQTETSQSKTFTFTETIIVPPSLNIVSSQLEWEDDVDNISVQVSLDGTTWQNCKNNSPIPYFNKNDGTTQGLLYLKVTMTSANTSTDLPILKSISLDFFSNNDFYSDNSGDRIYSTKDYGLSRYNHPIVSYSDYNGLRMYNGGGFNVDSSNSFRSIEMIFTPVSGENVLFSSNTKIFEWDGSGVINKSGISAIYVNGIDRTASTNISSFLTTGAPHHIILVLSSVATSNIKFNYNQADTKSGGANIYSNIALYPEVLSGVQATSHYELYTRQYSIYVADTSLQVSEASTGNDGTAYLINNTEYQSSNI